MKLNIFRLSALLLFFSLMVSCNKNFEEINTNPNGIRYVSPDQILPTALVGAFTYNMLRNRNFNNELMQVTVNSTDAEGAVFRYDFRANWADYLWNGLYSELTNFKDLYRDSTSNNNNSYKGISLICQVWLYSILTDTYGDVPFSESNSAKAAYGGIEEPKFDRQKDIYLGMFDMLEEANTLLTSNAAINANRDPVYNGDIAGWRKFGNSLYLRLLMRVSGKSEVSAQVIAKIKEIIDGNPTKYPVIETVGESANLQWTNQAPYVSPFFSIREQDFRSPGLAAFFINNIRDWDDPRLNITTYGRGGVNRWGISQGPNGFAGIPSGYAQGDAEIIKQSYFYSMTNTNNNLQTDPMTGIMMMAAEVSLIKAEAALKGWINGSAEQFYNEGAEKSIKYWIPDWPKGADEGMDIVTQLTKGDIDWIESAPFDRKMELIHLQKYYALFLTDMQQWFEYRRTGYPDLPKGPGLRNGGVMPARMTYPVYVQSTNPTNYKLAIEAQGPDLISTEVWWQKP